MSLIDGREIASAEKALLAERVERLGARSVVPKLTLIRFAEDPSADSYARALVRICAEVGLELDQRINSSEIDQTEALRIIQESADDRGVHGVLIQTPTPPHLPIANLTEAIPPEKDVDGVNPLSLGRLLAGSEAHVPATAAAVMRLIASTGTSLEGRDAVVIGRSLTVGKPVAILLLDQNATVTLCHSRTVNLVERTRKADFLVVAVGKPEVIGCEHVKPGAVVIDVGINVTATGIVGDVKPEVAGTARLSPVPGGDCTGGANLAVVLVDQSLGSC